MGRSLLRQRTGVVKQHMTFGRQFAISTLVVAQLVLTGCGKKKPQLPPQAKAPVDTVAVPLPDEISEASHHRRRLYLSRLTPPQEPPKPEPTTHRKKKKQAQPPASTQSGPANSAAGASGNSTLADGPSPGQPCG